jgi:hypothetical protein
VTPSDPERRLREVLARVEKTQIKGRQTDGSTTKSSN